MRVSTWNGQIAQTMTTSKHQTQSGKVITASPAIPYGTPQPRRPSRTAECARVHVKKPCVGKSYTARGSQKPHLTRCFYSYLSMLSVTSARPSRTFAPNWPAKVSNFFTLPASYGRDFATKERNPLFLLATQKLARDMHAVWAKTAGHAPLGHDLRPT